MLDPHPEDHLFTSQHKHHKSSTYSQQSLPRQYLSSSTTTSTARGQQPHAPIGGGPGGHPQASSPLGFSSATLQPRQQYGGGLLAGIQRVTKPSSQGASSDHESSV